jgi:biotin synthase
LQDPRDIQRLLDKAYQVKAAAVGKTVYFRGLIEFSNICTKNCFYCGIRKGNQNVTRYTLSEADVLASARFALEQGYGSVVLQSGERSDPAFVDLVNSLLRQIKELSAGKLGVTLSTGEQSEETYRSFYASGAHRYLLRIETSSPAHYRQLHPADHSFEQRLACLRSLKKLRFQVGTGVMIGLPFQTVENLAHDLLFFREFDVDMVGMGPYIEHADTPLYRERAALMPQAERFTLSLKMIAMLRLLMPDINIASTTALQTLDPAGREKGLLAGANIIMPNITPRAVRKNYLLYENKPCLEDDAATCKGCLERRIKAAGETIGYGEWGDSRHFSRGRERSGD